MEDCILTKEAICVIEKFIGYEFKNKHLLSMAFTHSSYANEQGIESNERLEFLGDSVLGLAVTDYLYKNYPKQNEGDYSKIKAYVVSTDYISKIVADADLGKYLFLVSEKIRQQPSKKMYANLFEAIVGAIYCEMGFMKAEDFVLRCVKERLMSVVSSNAVIDYKSALQELIQSKKGETLEYVFISKIGPDHNPTFTFDVLINGIAMGRGIGKSKAKAQFLASKNAYQKYVSEH